MRQRLVAAHAIGSRHAAASANASAAIFGIILAHALQHMLDHVRKLRVECVHGENKGLALAWACAGASLPRLLSAFSMLPPLPLPAPLYLSSSWNMPCCECFKHDVRKLGYLSTP